MIEPHISRALDWLGASAEKLSWWAYNLRGRIHLARLYRMAAPRS